MPLDNMPLDQLKNLAPAETFWEEDHTSHSLLGDKLKNLAPAETFWEEHHTSYDKLATAVTLAAAAALLGTCVMSRHCLPNVEFFRGASDIPEGGLALSPIGRGTENAAVERGLEDPTNLTRATQADGAGALRSQLNGHIEIPSLPADPVTFRDSTFMALKTMNKTAALARDPRSGIPQSFDQLLVPISKGLLGSLNDLQIASEAAPNLTSTLV